MSATGSTQAETTADQSLVADVSWRKMALIAGLSLLVIALLAPFVVFGVLGALVVPGNSPATFDNIVASEGLFRAGIAAFLVVIMLDVVVAWALYVLLRPVNRAVALLTAWLRLAFAAVFGGALVNLLDAAELVAGAGESTLPLEQLYAQVMSSIASFEVGWTGIALAIFGLHLLGLGYLLFKSEDFSKVLGVLVIIAGGGYLFDSFGTILVADYGLTIAMFTFVGEALLIFWLLWRAIRGFPSDSERPGEGLKATRLAQPASSAPMSR
ncbi:MAG: DUF4386 domain-containing protein [Acidimicrobiia bacterium]